MPNNYDPLNFSQYTPDWLDQEEEDTTDLDTEEAIAFIEQDMGRKLSAAERERVRRGMSKGGAFSLEQPVNDPLDFSSYTPEWTTETSARPSAPVLPVAKAEQPEEEGYFDKVVSNAKAQFAQLRDMGSNLFGHAELNIASRTVDDAVAGVQGDEAVDLARERFFARFGYYPDEANYQGRKKEAREEFAQEVEEARKTEATLPKELQSIEERLGGSSSAASRLSRVTGSVIPTLPEQLGPVVGGIIGSVAGSELGPGGTYAGGLVGAAIGSAPLVQITYRSAYREAIEKFGATPEEANQYALAMGAVEFGMEAVGGKLSAGALKVLGMNELTEQAAKKGLASVIRSRTARVAGGAAVEAGTEAGTELASEGVRNVMEATDFLEDPESRKKLAKYNAEQAANRLDRILDAGLGGFLVGGGIGAPIAHVAVAAEEGAQYQRTLSDTLENTDREVTDALKREEQRIQESEAIQQKADEEEAGFRTIERLALADKLSQNPAVTVAPVKFVTPEEIKAEREQAEKAPVQGTQPVAVGPQGQKLRDGQPLAAPVAAPATPASKTTGKKVKPAVARPRKPDKDLKDREVTELFDGLKKLTPVNMKTEESSQTSNKPFEDVAKNVIRSLVSRNTQPTADVQNLLRQGKMILAPNPESIGREDTGGAAQFDPETGKMYLYTDSLGDTDVVSTLMGALHESTHTGQFNDREGRPSILKQMMGQELENKVKNTIRSAYGKNKIATAAIDKAKQESPDAEIENLELVPYFVSEATKAREGFGRLGAVVRDIKAAARGFVREKLGVDMDITLDEIEAATQKVAGEIVQTDVKSAEGKPLDMIGGLRGAKFREAASKNKIYKGRVDGSWRYEFTDHEAELVASGNSTADRADREVRNYQLINYGKTLRLENVLDHKELYDNYPDAKDIKVKVNPNMGVGHFGTFDKKNNTIEINSALLSEHPETMKNLRKTILHEVQHWVQAKEGFIGGANSRAFIPEEVVTAQKLAEDSYEETIKNFDLDDALNTISREERSNFDESVDRDNKTNPDAEEDAKIAFLQYWARKSDSIKVRAFGELFKDLEDRLSKANDDLAAAESKAFKIYLRDYGETEARNTEYRSRMTPEQRSQTPPESTMAGAKGQVPVEKTIDTKPFRGKPNDVPESRALNMAAPDKEPVLPLTRKLPTWISGLLASTAGSGATAREIFEHAAASPAAERMKAEATIGKYRDGVKALAAERGMTPEALNDEIQTKLDAISKKSNKYSTNLRKFEEVANQYGEAGKALIEFRNQVDRLSIQMVKDRIAQGTPLTEEEQETFDTMKANLGRYSHRQYAIHFGKSGKEYAETIWNDYEKRKKAGKGDAKVEANYKRVAAAVKRLIDDELMIPDDAALAEKHADAVRRMYSVWSDVTNPDTVGLGDMRQFLSTRRDAINQNDDLLKATAEKIAKDILGLMPDIADKSLTAQYYTGGKINKGILKERIAIPTEIRNLMGEIKDPAMRLFATVAKQTEFIARQKMLTELRDNVEPTHLQPPGPAGRPEVKGMIQLKGDSYGALQNHYVSENLASMLSEYVQQLATFEQAVAIAAARPNALTQLAANKLVKGWGSLTGKAKMIQIVGNPMNYLFNFMGGGRTMLINGNINPNTFFKAFDTARRIITYAARPSTANEEVRRVTSAGVTDSAFVGEIRSEEYKELRDVINQMQGKTRNQMVNIGSDIATMGKETYAMMDVVYKIANFYHQADVVLPAYYEAAGIKKSQKEIDREAADIVNATNVTYKRAAPIVRGLEKLGISNFGTFFYEVFRTEINNVRQGLNELQRAKNAPNDKAAAIMWQQGSKRIIGQLGVWGLTAAAARLLASMTFGDDEEEEKKLRNMLPEYMRNQDFVSLGKDENGKDILFSVSRIDPAGPMTDIMRSLLNQDGDIDAVAKNIYQLYVAPRIGVQIAEAIGVSTGLVDKRVRTPFIQEMAPTAYGKALEGTSTVMEDRTAKAWTNAAETLLPGIVGGWRESNPVPEVTDPASAGAAMMAYMGGRMYKVDNESALSTAGFEYSDVLKSNRRQIVDLFNDHPDMDSNTLIAYLGDMKEDEQEAYNRLRDVYEGMTTLDHKPSDITKKLKQQGVAVSSIGDIKKGEFVFRSLSQESVKKFRDKELAKAKPEDRAEIRQKWKDAWELLRISSENLENEED